MSEIEITYFSDVLCVWAYVAQARIEAVKEKFGKSVRIEQRFCSVFGEPPRRLRRPGRIGAAMKDSVRICGMWRTGSPTSWCTRRSG